MPQAAPIKELGKGVSSKFGTSALSLYTMEEVLPLIYKVPGRLPTVPRELLLGCLRDGRLRVIEPFLVKYTLENQHVIAEAVDINEFGFGNSLSEALCDLQGTIAELYFTLEDNDNRLGPDLQQVWTTLRRQLARRP